MNAEHIEARACIPDEQSFARLVHHLHLAFIAGDRVIARAELSERCLRLFRRNGYAVIETREPGGLAVTVDVSAAVSCPIVTSEVRPAAALRLYARPSGVINIELLDEIGIVRAAACMDVDSFSHFLTHGLDIFELANAGGLISQPCKGAGLVA
jgi:hypothetical protein